MHKTSMHNYTCTFGYITQASMVVQNTFSSMLLEQQSQSVMQKMEKALFVVLISFWKTCSFNLHRIHCFQEWQYKVKVELGLAVSACLISLHIHLLPVPQLSTQQDCPMPLLNALQNTALLLPIRGWGQSTVHSLPFRLAWVHQLAVRTLCTISTNHQAQTRSQVPQGEAVQQQHLHPACCQGVQTTNQ